jgi:DNA-binding NarL/FixJ family response regulator
MRWRDRARTCEAVTFGIADRLVIEPGTVTRHLDLIYARLGVTNRTAAARCLRDAGR